MRFRELPFEGIVFVQGIPLSYDEIYLFAILSNKEATAKELH